MERTIVKFRWYPIRLSVFILAFIHRHTYTLNLFLSVATEICINIIEVIFYNLFLLLSNVVLTSFVVSTCRPSSCCVRAVRDSVVWIFHSLFSLVPFERLLSCLKFFSIIYSTAECCSELSCTSVVVHLTSSFLRQWFLSFALLIAQRAVLDCLESFGMVYEVWLGYHCPRILVKYSGSSSRGIKRQT